MQRVRATLRDYVDVSAQRTAEFGLPPRRDHLKLVDHIQAIERSGETRRIVVVRKPVDNKTVGEIALAADRNSLPRNRRGFGEELVGRSVGGRESGAEQGHIQK